MGSLKTNNKGDNFSLSRYNNEIARTFLRFGSAVILSTGTCIVSIISRRLKQKVVNILWKCFLLTFWLKFRAIPCSGCCKMRKHW